MKKILNAGEKSCKRKFFYEEQNFKRSKSKLSVYYSILRDLLKEGKENGQGLKHVIKNIEEACRQIDDDLFLMKAEKDITNKIMIPRIIKMMTWIDTEFDELVDVNMSVKSAITSTKLNPFCTDKGDTFVPVPISGSFQIVMRKDKKLYALKCVLDNNPFKTRGEGTAINSPELLMEIFLCEEMYPNQSVTPINLYLWQGDEKKGDFSNDFEFDDKSTKGNVVKAEEFSAIAANKLKELVIKYHNAGDERCEGEACRMCPYKDICLYVKPVEGIEIKKIKNVKKASSKMQYTEDQQAFINFDRGIARVVAGAGSGKTTSVIGRIINLIKTDNVQPYDFLLTTFTEKGICEIKEKLNYWLNIEGLPYDADEFKITNFNTFGFEVVCANYRELGFSETPKLLDKAKKMEVLSEILDEQGHMVGLNYYNPMLSNKNTGGALVKIANMIETMKEEDVKDIKECYSLFPVEKYGVITGTYKDINPETGRPKTYNIYEFDYKGLFNIYQKYLERTYSQGYIEFVDQVKLAIQVLQNPDVRQKYAYKHITIDEFQDSHDSEMDMIKILANMPECRSLVVVGDDAQSIYSFRGVCMKNIIEFPNVFEGCQEFTLVDNFRSTQEILDVANEVIATSKSNIHKNLVGHKTGEKPVIIQSTNVNQTVVEQIEEKLKVCNPVDVAVIARTRAELAKVAEELNQKGIPAIMSVSEFINDSPVIVAMNGLLNFIKNPELTYELAKYLIVAEHDELVAQKEFGAYVDEKAQLMQLHIKDMNEEELFQYVMDKIMIIAKEDSSAEVLFEAMKEDNCESFEDIHKFIRRIITFKTDLSVKASEETYDAVTLTTAHAAKGREFKNVITLTDHFDFKRGGDEEIRLLFVALTRAMDTLTIVKSKKDLPVGLYNATKNELVQPIGFVLENEKNEKNED